MLAFKIVDKELKNAILGYAVVKQLTVDEDWFNSTEGYISIGTSKKYQIAGNSTDAPYIKKGVRIIHGITSNATEIFTEIDFLIPVTEEVETPEEDTLNYVETEALVKLHSQIKKNRKSPKNYNLMIVEGEYKAVILEKVNILISNGAEDLGNIAELIQNV